MTRPLTCQTWTQVEDHYLLDNIRRLSPRMIAEDLGRTKSSVESRVKTLRRKGIKIAAIPAGSRPAKNVDQQSGRLISEPKLPLSVERETLRDELAAYLASRIQAKQMTVTQAKVLARRLNRLVIHAPEQRFYQFTTMSVRRVIDTVEAA